MAELHGFWMGLSHYLSGMILQVWAMFGRNDEAWWCRQVTKNWDDPPSTLLKKNLTHIPFKPKKEHVFFFGLYVGSGSRGSDFNLSLEISKCWWIHISPMTQSWIKIYTTENKKTNVPPQGPFFQSKGSSSQPPPWGESCELWVLSFDGRNPANQLRLGFMTLSHYLQGLVNPRCCRISEPSTVLPASMYVWTPFFSHASRKKRPK